LISLAALIEPRDVKTTDHAPRNIKCADLPNLAELYLHAYGTETSPLDAETAACRISAVFAGAHGSPIPHASLLTADAEGHLTAAILTTDRALGTDGPRTAFIAELFTHPVHRRQGLAEELLSHALQALHDTGHKTVATTVDSANAAAIALYLSRDFRRVAQPAEND
jgi:ribosomal protein S18 acetylase RimI-like enzyme